jgi:hypothetical protein
MIRKFFRSGSTYRSANYRAVHPNSQCQSSSNPPYVASVLDFNSLAAQISTPRIFDTSSPWGVTFWLGSTANRPVGPANYYYTEVIKEIQQGVSQNGQVVCSPVRTPETTPDFPINTPFWLCVVDQAPKISNGQSAAFSLNSAVEFEVQMDSALQRIPETITVNGLPPGLSLNFSKTPASSWNGTYFEPVNYLPKITGTPTAAGQYTATFTAANIIGSTTTTLSINVVQGPLFSVSRNSISNLNSNFGTPSSAQTFVLSASGLTANVAVTAPTNFEVSANGTTFSESLTLAPTSGSVTRTISVRTVAFAAQGSISGSVSITSPGVASLSVSVSGEISPVNQPTLGVSPLSLSGFTTVTQTPSANKEFSVIGYLLTNDVSINAPTAFEVSLDGSVFGNSLTIPRNSALAGVPVYVRIKSSSTVSIVSGSVSVSSVGTQTKSVSVQGQVQANVADLIDGQIFTAIRGVPFQAQLQAIGPVVRFELPPSWSPNPFPNWLSISSSGVISGTPPAAEPLRTISVAVIGLNSQSVEDFALEVTGPLPPTITVSPQSLTGFSTTAGSPSPSQLFQVSGASLSTGIVVSAPNNFEVSIDNTNFSPSLTLPLTGSAVATTTAYARISASASAGTASGNLTFTSVGASSQSISLSGTVNPALTRPVTFLVDMSIQIALGRFFPAFDRVEVRGVFNNFAGTELFDADGDGIYSGTLIISGSLGTIQNYKFFVATNDLSWEAGADRTFTLGVGNTAQILDVVYFNNISTLPPVLVGTSQVVSLYVGGNTVTRMHLGEVQVFP